MDRMERMTRTSRRWPNWIATASLALFAAWGAPALAAGGTVTGQVAATPGKFLQDTVIYIKDVPRAYAPRSANLDQKGMMFLPRILTIAKGDTVHFLNHDTVNHNVFSPDFESYNLGAFKPGEMRTHVFSDTVGVYTQLCSIHPEMLAYIFVGQNPYSAVVDATGRYAIKDVPAGTYQLAAWNPQLKAPGQSVVVADGKTTEANVSLKR
jgi:plastocyanin